MSSYNGAILISSLEPLAWVQDPAYGSVREFAFTDGEGLLGADESLQDHEYTVTEKVGSDSGLAGPRLVLKSMITAARFVQLIIQRLLALAVGKLINTSQRTLALSARRSL